MPHPTPPGARRSPPASGRHLSAAPPRRTTHRRGATSPATLGRRVHTHSRVPPTPGRSRRGPSGWRLPAATWTSPRSAAPNPSSARPRRAEATVNRVRRAKTPTPHGLPIRQGQRPPPVSRPNPRRAAPAAPPNSTRRQPHSPPRRRRGSPIRQNPHRGTARRHQWRDRRASPARWATTAPSAPLRPRRAARRRRPARRARWLPVPIRRHRPQGRRWRAKTAVAQRHTWVVQRYRLRQLTRASPPPCR